MASESTYSQQSSQLSPSSKVSFKCGDGIIAFNNAVALLEHPNVNDATKTITFSLSSFEKPMSFTRNEFISAIGLPICENDVPLPNKETVKAGLATLVLSNSPRDESKGKGIAVEKEPLNLLLPLIEQSGPDPKMLNLDQFSISKKKLKKLSLTEIQAQAQKLAEYEAKRKRMLKEYTHYVTFRADPLPITKISYKADKLELTPPPQLSAFDLLDLKRRESEPLKYLRKRRIPSGHYCLADQTSERHSEGISKGKGNVRKNE
ncbi:hypothetical protein Tco_1427278, partial [Tanacetum coccineum]